MLIIFLLFHIKLDGRRIDDLTEAMTKMTVNVNNLVNCVSVSSDRNKSWAKPAIPFHASTSATDAQPEAVRYALLQI
jgi:hypothetical protein